MTRYKTPKFVDHLTTYVANLTFVTSSTSKYDPNVNTVLEKLHLHLISRK